MGHSWLREGRRPPQAVLEIIESFFHRVACLVYLGAVSLEIGWNLNRTLEMLQFLQEKGVVRPLTNHEKQRHGFPEIADVWCLNVVQQLNKARF